MSKYTTEVRYICETNTAHPVEGRGFNSIDEILNECHANIFNFDYPIFDPTYKPTLEKKILRHFYTREICEETVGLWKLRLCDKLNVIMPYYNQMYESALLEFNPLYDIDYTIDGTKNDQGLKTNTKQKSGNEDINTGNLSTSTKQENTNKTSMGSDATINTQIQTNDRTDLTTNDLASSSSTTDSKRGSGSSQNSNSSSDTAWQYYSDTPQGQVSNITNGYLTNVTKKTDEASNSGNSSSSYSETGGTTESSTETGTVRLDINGRIEGRNNSTTVKDNEDHENKNETNKTVENENKNKSYEQKDRSTGIIKNMNEYTEHVSGKKGSVNYSKMLIDFRSTFLNIDKMILDELEPLFFGLW